MKSALVLVFVAVFLAVVGVGVFAMGHENGFGHSGCLAAPAQGTNCPLGGLSFEMVSSHLGVFLVLSSVVYPAAANFLMIAIIVFLGLSATHLFSPNLNIVPLWHPAGINRFAAIPLKSRLFRWLALHENSPNFS